MALVKPGDGVFTAAEERAYTYEAFAIQARLVWASAALVGGGAVATGTLLAALTPELPVLWVASGVLWTGAVGAFLFAGTIAVAYQVVFNDLQLGPSIDLATWPSSGMDPETLSSMAPVAFWARMAAAGGMLGGGLICAVALAALQVTQDNLDVGLRAASAVGTGAALSTAGLGVLLFLSPTPFEVEADIRLGE